MKQVRLLQPHTHAGQKLAAGATLQIKDETADWLVAQRVAVFVDSTESVAVTRFAPIRPNVGRSWSSCCGPRK